MYVRAERLKWYDKILQLCEYFGYSDQRKDIQAIPYFITSGKRQNGENGLCIYRAENALAIE